MTIEFFEGPAGTGKTHQMVQRAEDVIRDGVLGEGQRILALTFMNGARRRLESRLGEIPALRRRFECQTFDVFARTVAARRRSLITPELQARVATLNEFDGPCALAASLLENEAVRRWVARCYAVVLVDEAQDLDVHRLAILQSLSLTCVVLVAADAFQCLFDARDTTALMEWLETSGTTRRLTQPQRTNQQGLLAAALAVRAAEDIKGVLTTRTFNNRTTWRGAGFQLLEVPATQANTALLAWSISNEFSQRQGQVAVITPDARNRIVRTALETVQTRQYVRANGSTFGPFRFSWDRNDTDEADALLADVELPDTASPLEFRALLRPVLQQASIAHACSRMDRLRRLSGKMEFTRQEFVELVRESVRNRSRMGVGHARGHAAMTVQRAKNREFSNVIMLWPHTVTGSALHLRRLLYNGITRARQNCTVIVLGQGRLNAPPFSP